jgi:hypothetical protein
MKRRRVLALLLSAFIGVSASVPVYADVAQAKTQVSQETFGEEVTGADLASQIASASKGDVIKLTADTNASTKGLIVEKGQDVTIDTNGHVLTLANSDDGNLKVYGKLTIIDSTGKGSVVSHTQYTPTVGNSKGKVLSTAATTGQAMIEVYGSGALKIGKGASVVQDAEPWTGADTTSLYRYGNTAIGLTGSSKVTVDGGSIKAGSYAIRVYDKQSLYRLDRKETVDSVEVIVKSGKVVSENNSAISAKADGEDSKAKVTVSGGTVTGGINGVEVYSQDVTVTGGTITTTGTEAGETDNCTNMTGDTALFVGGRAQSSKVGISGGTFKAPADVPAVLDEGMTNVTYNYLCGIYDIKGGTYTAEVHSRQMQPGYINKKNADGLWVVTAGKATPTPTPKVSPKPTTAGPTKKPTPTPAGKRVKYSELNLDGKCSLKNLLGV